MQTSAPTGPQEEDLDGQGRAASRLLAYLPRGNTLDDRSWHRRHRLLQWVLLLHVPGMLALGLLLENSPLVIGYVLIAPVACLVLGHVIRTRRLASFFVTGGLVFCSAGLVVLTSGSIEAHFHFFIIIGFIALYQDWVPFLWNVAFTVLSHGIGTIWLGNLIFSHPAGQANPWLWSAIHGLSVLLTCAGVVVFWKTNEDEQKRTIELTGKLAAAEISHRRFTSDLLVNLARRNQSLLYRQLSVINQLEEQEQDPDALADLFRLDHLATRIRRNAESLLVLSGEQSPRTWSRPVPLLDVVRAAIAETEDLDRVVFAIDERLAVQGGAVADMTHLLAELVENAARFSPPDTSVNVRARPQGSGGHVITVEDWGVGMPAADLATANELLAAAPEVDLSVSQRLGLHVVARLAQRHGIRTALTATPGGGITAVVMAPAELFTSLEPAAAAPVGRKPALAASTEPPAAAPWPPHNSNRHNGNGNGRASHLAAGQPLADGLVAPQHLATPSMPVAAGPPGARWGDLTAGEPHMMRRTPQASLVPELRNDGPPTPPAGPAAPADRRAGAAQARAALSRYQASRRAARKVVERPDAGGSPHDAGTRRAGGDDRR